MNKPTARQSSKEFLSVGILNCSQGSRLADAVAALTSQFEPPSEITVVDDASTDNSAAILKGLVDEIPHVRAIQNKGPLGAIANLNKILEISSGEIIYFTTPGGVLSAGFLKKAIESLARQPQAALCLGLSPAAIQSILAHLRGDKADIEGHKFLKPDEFVRALMKCEFPFRFETAIFRRQALLEMGGFSEAPNSLFDGFIMQVLSLRHGACVLSAPVAQGCGGESDYFHENACELKKKVEAIVGIENAMGTTYGALFSPKYPANWSRRQRYKSCLSAWNMAADCSIKYLCESPSLKILTRNPCFLDAAFKFLFRAVVAMQSFFIKAILALHFKTFYFGFRK